MNTRTLTVIQILVLLGFGVVLVGSNADCGPEIVGADEARLGSPSFQGLTQQASTRITSQGVTSLDPSMGGVRSTADAMPPATLAQVSAASGGQVALVLEADPDTFQLICDHESGMDDATECLAEGFARFDIVERGDTAAFTAALLLTQPTPELSSQAVFEIDCGLGPGFEQIISESDSDRSQVLDVPVDPSASSCLARIFFVDEYASSSTGVNASNAASLTVRNPAAIECTDASVCPSTEPFCGSDGICHDGGTAQRCEVQALHCDGTTHPYCTGQNFLGTNGCSTGRFSPCFWDGQCASGYSCSFGLCEPDAPAAPGDCGAGENFVSGGGGACLPRPEGDICETCWVSGGCTAADSSGNGICQSGLCTRFGLQGESCNNTCEQCEFGLYCDSGGGTCEDQVPLGAACGSQNDACQDFPPFNSCIGGTCAPKGGSGDACEENVDCTFGRFCVGGTCT